MNEAYWIESAGGKTYDKLEKDMETEYLIIGGGFAGVTCFYLLAGAGLQVMLIDADRVGYGVSGRNTGKVSAQHGLIYHSLVNKFGLERAKLYYEINQKAVDFIENTIAQYKIDCGFIRLPSYVYTNHDDYVKRIENEYQAYESLGIEGGITEEIPLPIQIQKAIYMSNQAQLHPKRYLDGLAAIGVERGGTLYENTRVVNFEPGGACRVTTADGTVIKARNVIITTHFPCYDGLGFYFAKLHPKRTYAVMADYGADFPKAHFINAENPTRSLRYIDEEKAILIVGESHKVGHQIDDHYSELKQFGYEVFGLSDYRFQWSAQDYTPPHKLPFIGYLNSDMKNVYVATGFNKWGLTTGTAAGLIISNMIQNGDSPYRQVYRHTTLSDIASKEFVIENADVAFQLVTGKLRLGDTELPDEKGVARVVNINGKRCGFYRDDQDEVYILDISCTHVGCELKWNELEKTWDCPCHGSRFDYKGNVLEGPAELPLKRYDEKKNKINPQII